MREDPMDDPRQREEFKYLYHSLLDYAHQYGGLTEGECEDIDAMVTYGRHLKRTCPHDDLDNLAASEAFSKLTTSLD